MRLKVAVELKKSFRHSLKLNLEVYMLIAQIFFFAILNDSLFDLCVVFSVSNFVPCSWLLSVTVAFLP